MGQERWGRAVEAATTGLAAGTALVAFGALGVASFRPEGLPAPYWIQLPGLRTDTTGTLCFVVATVGFAISEGLRLARRQTAAVPGSASSPGRPTSARTPALIHGAARALTAAGTVLVLYLSVNAVTHPWSLTLPASHLLSWPTESTLRVAALVVVAVSAGVARFQGIGPSDE
jgi:hypothetical protein